MAYYSNNKLAALAVTIMLLLQLALAQRPFFAGLRPPGLNQKDKYNMNNNNNNNSNSNIDITNRFGQPNEVTLPFGATQKPPANYVPVVFPDSNFRPLATPASSAQPPTNIIASRFGGADNATKNSYVPPASNSVAAAAGAGALPDRLPIDAQNDKDLVAILSRLPPDQRPFWYINAAAIEAHRNGSFRSFAGAADSPRSFFG